jgi:peptidoglycan/LPS O-acetylase OafA/YrhL
MEIFDMLNEPDQEIDWTSTKIMSRVSLEQKKKLEIHPNSTTARFDAIDGLRGIACLGVVILHCYTLAGKYPVPFSLQYVIDYGYVGVDVFFTLSGFCLAYPIFKKKIKNFKWNQYLWNRAKRVLPPYWIILVISLIVSKISFHFHLQDVGLDTEFIWKPSLSDIVKNFSLIQSNSYILSSWTLPVEWRWYLILPLFVFLARFSIYLPVFLSIGISIVSVFFLESPSISPKLFTWITPLPIYLPTFIAGIWIAYLCQKETTSVFEKVLQKYSRYFFLFSIVMALIEDPKWNIASSRAVAWAPVCFFLLLAALYDRKVKAILEWGPIVKVGVFSYSLYLTHEILIKFLYLISFQLRIPASFQWIFHLLLTLPACILIGYLFFKLVEQPLLKLSQKVKF